MTQMQRIHLHGRFFNPLPDGKILVMAKFKPFADDISNILYNSKFVFHRAEHTVVGGENAGYQQFLLFPQCFQKAYFSGSSKVRIIW